MACRNLERHVLGKRGVLLSHSADLYMEVLTCSIKKLETMKKDRDVYQLCITAEAEKREKNEAAIGGLLQMARESNPRDNEPHGSEDRDARSRSCGGT